VSRVQGLCLKTAKHLCTCKAAPVEPGRGACVRRQLASPMHHLSWRIHPSNNASLMKPESGRKDKSSQWLNMVGSLSGRTLNKQSLKHSNAILGSYLGASETIGAPRMLRESFTTMVVQLA